MTKQRIITAAILIPLFLGVLFFLPPQAFLFFTAFAILGGAWEWSNFMQVKSKWGRLVYLLLVLIGMITAAIFIMVPTILGTAMGWWLLAFLLVAAYPRGTWWARGAVYRGLMGLMVLIPCWVAINYIRAQVDGIFILLYLFVLIWGADSAAYFAGRAWGKRKLAPAVSPGKSIEGLLGALASTVVIAVIALLLTKQPVGEWPFGILLSLITVLFSVLGDLFESALKRQAGLKDSGKLLPGHGGLLDRIDSLTAAAPVFAFGAWLLGIYLA